MQTTASTVRDSTIFLNSATDGGGIYVENSQLTVIDTQIINNNAQNRGGGIDAVNSEIGEFGCTVLHQYATLGRYDFLTIIEAPDEVTVAHLVVGLQSRGTVFIETMPAVERAEFLDKLKGPKNLGKADD